MSATTLAFSRLMTTAIADRNYRGGNVVAGKRCPGSSAKEVLPASYLTRVAVDHPALNEG